MLSEQYVSIYESIGGAEGVETAVDIFYRKVLTDYRVSRFFNVVDMDAQRNRQKAFLTMAFGGPTNYTGKDMREAHAHLDLKQEHFEAVVEALEGALLEMKVPQERINEVLAVAYSVKDEVLNR